MTRMRILLAALALFLFPLAPAMAQIVPIPPAQSGAAPAEAAPSANDVQELLRILGDPRVVEWLKRNVEGAPAATAEGEQHSLRSSIEARLALARQRMAELSRAWSNFPLIPEALAEAWDAELSRGDALRSLTYVIIFLFVGGGLEWLFWQYFHALAIRIEHLRPTSLWRRAANAVARLLLQLCALLLFALGSVGTFLSFDWPQFLERVVVNLLLAVIGIRLLALASRFVLAPYNSQLRLVPLKDAFALHVHHWHLAVATILVFSLAASDTLAGLALLAKEAPDAVDAALAVSVALGGMAVVALLAMIWSLSQQLAQETLDTGTHTPRHVDPLSIKILPIGLTVVVLAAYMAWVFNANELVWTILVIGLFLPAARVVRAIVDHFFDQIEETAEAAGTDAASANDDASEDMSSEIDSTPVIASPDAAGRRDVSNERFATYRPIARRLTRFLLAAIALVILLAGWGTSIAALSQSPNFAGRVVKIAIDIVAALLVADLVWIWAKTAIDLRLSRYVAPPPGEPPGPEARMATLLPLLRNILMVAVVALVGLTILSSLGVNVAPLLAGAGIAGVAIGFGAQSLVRDIVSGIFYLIDDAFRVGEYIEIGDLRGTVESMSLRSMRVRHHRGAVHTIPFGELKSLTNYSRDWVIMKLEFRVPFATDLKLVKKLVKQVGAELQADPNYGHNIIEPLKSQGVRRMEEFNMVVGVKFMAKPGAQWVIRRDAYQKLRDVFERNGINFAERNVKVEVLTDRPLPEEVEKAVTGAAQAAIEARKPAEPLPDEP